MSDERLRHVFHLNEFSHDHWEAIGKMLGGAHIVKYLLTGELKVSVPLFCNRQEYEIPVLGASTLVQMKEKGSVLISQELFDELCKLSSDGNFHIHIACERTLVRLEDMDILEPEKRSVFSLQHFSCLVAQLISDQGNGLKGLLHIGQRANVFYVEMPNGLFVPISVSRYDLLGKWGIEMLYHGQASWNKDTIIFRYLGVEK